MKCRIFIDREHDEETLIYAHERTKLVESIRELIEENAFELVGYMDREAVRLSLGDIHYFAVEDNRIYAQQGSKKLQLRCRLYQLEEMLPESFVKINQSCIANIKSIERFDVSVSGSLLVRFKNGYTDCVSRRNMKNVKERLGL